MSSGVVFRILRQDGPKLFETRRIEELAPELEPHSTIAAALFRIQDDPRTRDGVQVAPVAFDAACHGDACGACTLLVNGVVRSACRTLVSQVAKQGRILLEPLTRFPLVRDLSVVRAAIRESFEALGATLDAGGTTPLSSKASRRLLAIDRCSECGACLEACPEYAAGAFAGAAALNELRVLELMPSAAAGASQRLDALLGDRGIAGCGKSENCVEVCPERIPLVDSILSLQRTATRRILGRRS